MIEVIQSSTFADWLSGLKDRRAKARIHYGPGYRLYFMQKGGVMVVLLCGGDKSTQQKDIKKAKRVAEAWEEGSNGN